MTFREELNSLMEKHGVTVVAEKIWLSDEDGEDYESSDCNYHFYRHDPFIRIEMAELCKPAVMNQNGQFTPIWMKNA